MATLLGRARAISLVVLEKAPVPPVGVVIEAVRAIVGLVLQVRVGT